ncbi:ABC transporter permease subunit [Kitasatospora sp. CMC57]|uniref:ABC transporter permease subunit n=1 Tax=Kitasatospora sp. CMC57 TaxID=3231513 RepID=A0AB33JS92_9ACTN
MTTTAVFRSEWTKFTTLRSQWFTPLLAVLLSVGITLAVNKAYAADTSLHEDPSVGLYYGLNFGQVALACFGVLLLGQEYDSGTVRASLTAVPRRGRLYLGKLLLGGGVGLLAGLLITAGSALSMNATDAWNFDLAEPGTVRSLAAGVLYCPLLVLLCLGLTAVLRNLTAAMGLITPMVFLGTTALSAIPGVRLAGQFLPDRAGQYAFRFQGDPNIWFGHWTGLLIMATWTALALYGGWRSLSRKDV